MKAVRMLFLIALIGALCFSPPTAAPAAAASALLHVSATILPWIDLSARQNAASFRVGEADLARGYIDLPGALSVRLRTNLPEGVVLRLAGRPAGVEAMEMALPGTPGTWGRTLRLERLAPGLPWAGDLSLRLRLMPGLLPGVYPLPATVTAELY